VEHTQEAGSIFQGARPRRPWVRQDRASGSQPRGPLVARGPAHRPTACVGLVWASRGLDPTSGLWTLTGR